MVEFTTQMKTIVTGEGKQKGNKTTIFSEKNNTIMVKKQIRNSNKDFSTSMVDACFSFDSWATSLLEHLKSMIVVAPKNHLMTNNISGHLRHLSIQKRHGFGFEH